MADINNQVNLNANTKRLSTRGRVTAIAANDNFVMNNAALLAA